ncbi:hypothetical protein HMPREF0765_1771 [Sphingobacterium spiritivorum ATCC 33300]|uniref:Uncharacterized protein n=1 Tax=Sphingobacterium spiritivorum ATCC 33300 TaxID=525372 RepID=C2FWR5_SPHSI|nr:hypothetical protein [Sphingobacterium spiritivorum]EEI92679.1 hypothetical protein HMPREF0765_1771 [Sphingobacterium spiritivorum ATCC 33300]QQS94133.1 hypothetical protein I6J03_11995 [Sphingobacterium spiritivorum]
MKIKASNLIILLIITFFSCKREVIIPLNEPKISTKEEIKKLASMHSGGLKYIKNFSAKTKIRVESQASHYSNIQSNETPNLQQADISAIYWGFHDYVSENNLQQYAFLGSSTPGFNFDNVSKISLSANNSAYSANFYILANQISNIEGNSLSEIETQINSIESSTTFQNLNQIEKTILLTSSEVFIDSYIHWSNEPQLNQIPQNIAARGWFGKFFKIVKSDFLGAVGGGLAGAAFGGQVGAGIGAVLGAINCSAIAALAAENPFIITIPEEFVVVNGITIPKQWDEIVVPNNNPIETPIGLNFPENYTGVYTYATDLASLSDSMVDPVTNVYKGANGLYYYNSNLTCLLPDGFYRNEGTYYKVFMGKVIETGTPLPQCLTCPGPSQPVFYPFVECE